MVKFLTTSVAALALAGTASAQLIPEDGGSSDLTINLNGTVEEICGITAASDTVDLEFEDLATSSSTVTETAPFGVVCNSAGGAILSVTSANQGFLIRNGSTGGAGNEIGYKVNVDTGTDAFSYTPGTPPLNLQTDRSFTIPAGDALREGRAVDAAFSVNGVAGPDFQGAPTTTVYAGAYSDTVTISLTAQ